jgi:ABC-2 type transport system permease protein
MTRWLRTLRAMLGAYYSYMVEYRLEIFLWTISGLLPFVSMAVWVQAGRTGGTLPLATEQIVRYFLAAFIIRQFTVVWVIWELEYDVVQGRLAPLLLHPIDPMWRYMMMHVAERGARLPLIAAIIVGFCVAYPPVMWRPTVLGVVAAALATTLAFALRFLIQYTFAMLAFWTERAAAIDRLFMIPMLFISGYIAPLEFFPPAVREAVLLTPFPYMLYFPTQLLLGEPVAIGRGFAVMLAWLAGTVALNRWMWRMGMRRFSAMGA